MNNPPNLDAAKATLADWNAWLAAMDGPIPGACHEVDPVFRSAVGHLRVALAHVDTLSTTLDAIRSTLDHIAHVGWDASCEAAAGDALEAGDATRLNRYAVRVAGERDEARAAALREAVAVLRELADNYLAAHGGGGDYCCALYDAASRIGALTTATDRSDDAR